MALSSDRFDPIHGTVTAQHDYKLAAGTVCYLGGIYVANDDGYLVSPATPPGAARKCVLALDSASNPTGTDGATSVRCAVRTVAFLPAAGLDQADIGRMLYATDDDAFTTEPTTCPVGELVAIDGNHALVAL